MSTGKVIGIGFAVFFAFLTITLWSSFNSLVSAKNAVEASISQVQNVLARQAELIPNIVESTKGYVNHESATFKAVVEARAQLTAIDKMDPREIAANPNLQKMFEARQTQMKNIGVALQAVQEAYPALKANTQFNTLTRELSGSINRVTTERQRSQLQIQAYNTKVQQLPTVLFAGMMGHKPYEFFRASEEAQTAPKVKF